jgi:hypothetical protein
LGPLALTQKLENVSCSHSKLHACKNRENWKRITQYANAVIAPHNNGNQRKPMWFENLNIMKMIGQVENCNKIRKHDCQRPLLKCSRNKLSSVSFFVPQRFTCKCGQRCGTYLWRGQSSPQRNTAQNVRGFASAANISEAGS